MKKVVIRTIDTDVVVLHLAYRYFVGNFEFLQHNLSVHFREKSAKHYYFSIASQVVIPCSRSFTKENVSDDQLNLLEKDFLYITEKLTRVCERLSTLLKIV